MLINVVTEWVSGAEGRPAPKLKDAVERMSEKQMEDAYNQVLGSFLERNKRLHIRLDGPKSGVQGWSRGSGVGDLGSGV